MNRPRILVLPLAAVADIHAIIMQGVLSGAFQKDEAGPTIAAGAALLAAFDDLDLLLQATAAFIHVYGCDPYSFATRLSRIAEDLGDCESVTFGPKVTTTPALAVPALRPAHSRISLHAIATPCAAAASSPS